MPSIFLPSTSLGPVQPFGVRSTIIRKSWTGPKEVDGKKIEGQLRAYIAQGEVLPVATRSFGGIGIFAIKEMGRFYRHVLIQKRYPHHGAVAFGHVGKTLFEVFKYLGIADIAYNQPKNLPYPTENPWA